MPEKDKDKKEKKDPTQELAMKEERLERFTYDTSDLASLFNIQVKESAKNYNFSVKKHNK